MRDARGTSFVKRTRPVHGRHGHLGGHAILVGAAMCPAAHSQMMEARTKVVALGVLTLALWVSDVPADTILAVPVSVSVVGSGSIRVRIATRVGSRSAPSMPCDSLDNLRLYEGYVSAGQTIDFSSPGLCVCEQHTYGAFRETNYTTSRVTCLIRDPVTGVLSPRINLSLSTDG